MRISLVLATYGRRDEVGKFLASLLEQTRVPHEVILVDQNPPGFLEEILRPYLRCLELKVFQVAAQGVSLARNLGLKHVTGTVVGFPDDDCLYQPDTLEQVEKAFAASPSVGGLLAQWYDPRHQAAEDGSRELSRYSAFIRSGTLVQFYRKSVVDAVGGFDPVLGPGTGLPYGSGEDTDYLIRVLLANYTVRYVPAITILHPDIQEQIPSDEKIRAYALGRMYLLRKHRYPVWFQLVNVLYPLLCLPLASKKTIRYRWKMFANRAAAFFCSSQSLASRF